MTKKNRLFSLFLFFFFTLIFNFSWFSNNLFSEEIKQEEEIGGGTVIVTYEIFPREDMIHRIRFWLRNEKLEAEMYPKDQNFVDDKESISRTVVIENLKPGKYEIQFLVPNKEGDFESIGPREILIEKESTLKIDQKIKTI